MRYTLEHYKQATMLNALTLHPEQQAEQQQSFRSLKLFNFKQSHFFNSSARSWIVLDSKSSFSCCLINL